MNVSDFETTQWSIVLRAGHSTDSDAGEALTYLCQRYWYPLYAFLRKKGYSIEAAEDVTQSFVAKLIENRALTLAIPQRGRFRSFLLASLQNFLINEWKHASAKKRGGHVVIVSMNVESGESKLNLQPSDDLTAEKIFERAWAVQLLQCVLEQLRQEYDQRSKLREFELLQKFLVGRSKDHSYDSVALELGITPDSLRQQSHRLRKRYRELLRLEVARTVGSQDEIEDEINRLFETLSSKEGRSCD